MKKHLYSLIAVVTLLVIAACGPTSPYSYETVENDPLNARIYTLDNGLKVYLTVNKESPRIQTFIPVRVGGKNDPDETTGLAHYFEHLMFKGTTNFGTQNYEQEKPMLDEIERLFEVYRKTTDEAERAALYHQIDSVSYEASKLAIPNEYDKLMAAIGAEGTNAYTSFDVTCYTEDIPSNEIENWARIQSDRFANNVIRGFHTELEAVYEEKNMSLTRDSRKLSEAMLSALFKNHPYGTHTVLGTQEDLKNPSITNIKNYYKQWYVPNNMAICMSGDLDFDQTIAIIDKYFGQLQPNPELPKTNFTPEEPITAPIEKEVLGLEAEQLMIAWRFPGARDLATTDLISITREVLNNGSAGIIDLNVNQQQLLLGAGAGHYGLSDYDVFILAARPKQGQTLEEAKEILLAQMEQLKQGNFDDKLVAACIANMKLSLQQEMEENSTRADFFVSSFVNGVAWKDMVETPARWDSITKEKVVAFAKENFNNNYAVLYKRQGKDPNEKKISKPAITPIFTNRDAVSDFLKEIQASNVTPIEPVFLNYKKDLTQTTAGKLPLLYVENNMNDLFTLQYRFETGSNRNKKLGLAADYLDYLGTADMTPEAIKQAFFNLACSYSISVSNEETTISVSGLSENMAAATALLEKLLMQAVPNANKLENLKSDNLKMRIDSKSNQNSNFTKLVNYVLYGEQNPQTYILSNSEIMKLTGEDLLAQIQELLKYEHQVIYYGPMSAKEVAAVVEKEHKTDEPLKPVDKTPAFNLQQTPENVVYIAPYDANQIYMLGYSNNGEKFDAEVIPNIEMFNNYFGGGMGGIVFQEMREARGLAYSANAYVSKPNRLEENVTFVTTIATQNDKMIDALKAFDEIINQMPTSEHAFNIAKESLITSLRTERITRSSIIYNYLRACKWGLDYDIREKVFEAVQNMTLQDVIDYQQKYIKDRKYIHGVLGRESDLDMKSLSEYGKIIHLTTEEIFGY